MAHTTIWALVAEGSQKPLTNLSKQDRDAYHRNYFIENVLFGIDNNIKLPGDGDPGVSLHALSLDLSEETIRIIEELIWESEIRDKSSEFAHHIINCCINLDSKHWLRPGTTWWQRLRVR